MKGCCCIELEIFTRIVGLFTILVSLFNIFGWFILGYHWHHIMVYMVMGPFLIAASLYMIRATYNKNPNYVTLWLVMIIISVVVTICNHSVWLYHHTDNLRAHDVDVHVFGLFVGFTVVVYLWLCVYAYHRNLCRDRVEK